MKVDYPKSVEEVEKADRRQACTWYRWLPTASTPEQEALMKAIIHRFTQLGGFTPELSKELCG